MTKVEIESNMDSTECDVLCPNCGSGKVRIDKKGKLVVMNIPDGLLEIN